MAETMTSARTVVGLFETLAAANHAADELIAAGFTRDQIGVIAGHELSNADHHVDATEDDAVKMKGAVGSGLALGGGLGLLAGLSALLIPGVGPLVIGGPLATAFMGAGLGAAVGGVMAGLMRAGVNESDARLFETGLRSGGVVITVHTDSVHAHEACEILDRNGALDLDEHSRTWRSSGTRAPGSAGDRVSDTNSRDHSEVPAGKNSATENKNFATDMESMALDENARRLEPWAKQAAILGGGAHVGDFDDEFHRDYQNRYAGTGVGYDRYQPAYKMGSEYARDSKYRDRDWSTIEPELRRDWESRGHGPWDNFKDAVRHGWHKVRGH